MNLEDAMRIRSSRTVLNTVVVIVSTLGASFTAEQAPPGNQNLTRLKSRIEEAYFLFTADRATTRSSR
jgi:hypothetical protein